MIFCPSGMASNYLICVLIFILTPSVYFATAQSASSVIDCRKEKICVINLEVSSKRTLVYQDKRTGRRRSVSLLPNSTFCDEELYMKEKVCQDIDPAKYPDMIIMDGIKRTVLTFNGQIPGPRIRARTNSILKINVRNKLLSSGVTVHWHGIHQRGSPQFDGVGQISQALIQPNEVFRYEFTAYPSGTNWYHSHVGALRSEGLYGALTVEDPDDAESHKYRYDRNEDEVIIIQDWQHRDGTEMYSEFEELSTAAFWYGGQVYQPTRGPDNTEIGPLPFTSGVINGRGWFTDDNKKQFKPELARIQVEQGKRCRLRIIGAQQVYAMRVSVEDHSMNLIASDGFELETSVSLFDYVIVHSGERYDVLVDTKHTGSYWIRAETLEVDYKTPGNPFPHEALAILDVVERGLSGFSQLPPSRIRKCTRSDPCDAANCPFQKYLPGANMTCHNFGVDIRTPTSDLSSIPKADRENIDEFFLNFAFDGPLDNSAINGRRFVTPATPLQINGMSAVNEPCKCDKSTDVDCQCTHIITLEPNRNILLVLTNVDNNGPIPGGTAHPIHVHGHSFAVLKMGFPVYNSSGFYVADNPDIGCVKNNTITCYSLQWRNNTRPTDFNWVDPPRKDTLVIPAGGYAALFFKSDNPGWWFVHCHIEVRNNVPDFL